MKREQAINDSVIAVQESFGACLPSSCYLRAQAEETLNPSELTHPHAKVNDNQVGVLAQIYVLRSIREAIGYSFLK